MAAAVALALPIDLQRANFGNRNLNLIQQRAKLKIMTKFYSLLCKKISCGVWKRFGSSFRSFVLMNVIRLKSNLTTLTVWLLFDASSDKSLSDRMVSLANFRSCFSCSIVHVVAASKTKDPRFCSSCSSAVSDPLSGADRIFLVSRSSSWAVNGETNHVTHRSFT